MSLPFLEALAAAPLVADGAMGSLLYERGVLVSRSFDEVNLSQPALVRRIHQQYLAAGAQLVESNTYGANRLRLQHHGLADRLEQINHAAVRLAREAVGTAAYVAGSIGPSGLAPAALAGAETTLHEAFAEQAAALAAAGCDLLMVETFHAPAELRLAVQAARRACDLPIVAHVAVDRHGRIADGQAPEALAAAMRAWGADVVGANCQGPAALFEVACRMARSGLPVSAMPNAGTPEHIEDRLIYLATPEHFGMYARRLYKAGVRLVGGCCGTQPAHIRRVAAAARMLAPRLELGGAPAAASGTPPRPLAQRSALGAALGSRFVVSVEVNPPAGLAVEAPVAAARMLQQHGADVINIADGPRATVRMSNLALAVHVRQAVDTEVLLHTCCRDRNLLSLQASALGAHVLGLRNLVVITGDPPKTGDHPEATAVYDLDAVGLLQLLDGFNRGLDAAGKAAAQTDFVLACGVEPAAADFAAEMARLRRKVAAGANLVMTQPVYEPRHLTRFLDASADLDVPVLVGILPLASARNAEFLHHNVPGMQVPAEIRARLAGAARGAAARACGVAIACEALHGVRDRVAGAYIMPPLGHYEMAAEIMASLGDDRALAPGVPGRQPQP